MKITRANIEDVIVLSKLYSRYDAKVMPCNLMRKRKRLMNLNRVDGLRAK